MLGRTIASNEGKWCNFEFSLAIHSDKPVWMAACLPRTFSRAEGLGLKLRGPQNFPMTWGGSPDAYASKVTNDGVVQAGDVPPKAAQRFN